MDGWDDLIPPAFDYLECGGVGTMMKTRKRPAGNAVRIAISRGAAEDERCSRSTD
ncbi:MAG: hypothetical protein ACLS8R_07280 [Anaeromassilibacillus sp.]